MQKRTILHCDCNSYFASVEAMLDPSLKGLPLAVAGDPQSRHGVVVAASMEAKKYGVRTTDTVYVAKKKCPELVVVMPHHSKYSEVSEMINRIYLEYTDLVEPFSVDESFLDLTGSPALRNRTGKEIADELRRRVKLEIGVTISVGVSFNKCFAKLASDMKKPDATTVIMPEDVENTVWPLPVSDLLFVGKSTAASLGRIGIVTIGDIARSGKDKMSELLGKHGAGLWDYASGNDTEPVRSYYDEREVKSVGNSFTFSRDLITPEDIRAGINMLAASVSGRLRRKGVLAGSVQVSIKDPDLKTIQRQRTLDVPTHLQREIAEIAFELVETNRNGSAVRLLGISCSELVPESEAVTQMSLFEGTGSTDRQRQEKLEDAVASIKKRMGKDSITLGFRRAEGSGIPGNEK
ncbi:MAG: DNA polymerase IV [Oscillospiraceae bacterium]|nr:DNA polymerase IV [Oscillospiraceae bacterium]